MGVTEPGTALEPAGTYRESLPAGSASGVRPNFSPMALIPPLTLSINDEKMPPEPKRRGMRRGRRGSRRERKEEREEKKEEANVRKKKKKEEKAYESKDEKEKEEGEVKRVLGATVPSGGGGGALKSLLEME